MAAPEDVSMHLFDDFHHYAARAVRDEPLDVPLDRAVLRWLWAHLRQALDLPNEPLLDTPALPRPSPQGLVPPAQATERVRAAVLEAPPRWRLLYLLALLSGLGARELSEALDAPEEEVRRARMHLSTTIHRRLAQ
jgi:DNA-directed RNA polymerase specialized sigma24 family protein